MKFFRYLFGFPVAVIITSLLFLVMYHLIREDGTTLPEIVKEIEEVLLPERNPPPPVPPENVGPPELPDPPSDPDPRKIPLPTPPKPIDPKPTKEVLGLPGGGGGTIVPVITPTGGYPILQVAPEYPTNCAMREVEGTATVEYDVTNGGRVVNARIIEASDSCFERSALRAIEKWTYSPIPDADPDLISRRGVQQIFVFELEAD